MCIINRPNACSVHLQDETTQFKMGMTNVDIEEVSLINFIGIKIFCSHKLNFTCLLALFPGSCVPTALQKHLTCLPV